MIPKHETYYGADQTMVLLNRENFDIHCRNIKIDVGEVSDPS